MKLLTLYGSSRKNGNSESLTKVLLQELNKEDYHEIYLMNYHIKPIVDKRHSEEGFQPVEDDYEEIAQKMLNHQAVLFVTPLYWYGMSGHLKNFIDRWTGSLRSKEYDFKEIMKGKKMYVLIVGGPASPLTGLPLVQQFQLISQFLQMEFAGYVIGKGVKPKEVLEDEDSILAAKQLGKKIKKDLE
ncbi:flavodoxin family protein [Tepidibacillus sp. HK-1]|uniref:flavodoxin family protein n=1 Tax=Tepidibacillus sp. HK-1 TaxID=1883407 RepID=UPI0008536DCC|nr:flavodoxin family protein [Tepidibacillus sp. HK-1]GBF10412.1 putative NAD(P)H-dependent FMN-containing oxidoreductase YwqN [Tepidibacillus sp. HK-1]